MKFKLDLQPSPPEQKINLRDGIYLTGSCFSEEIAELLVENRLSCLSNPFGTLYNPISQFELLSDQVNSDQIVDSQGIYYHWQTHGSISGLTRDEVVNKFNQQQKQSRSFLKDAKWLILTMGTAWVYRLKESGRIVGNCHKVPSSKFTKELLDVATITERFEATYESLKSINPELQIILTISPVRHIRDGLVENNQSKAILIEAVRQINECHPNISYFPSYEIMIDELRDYRFYEADMIHPNKPAINYIWEKFRDTYFDDETLAFLSRWDKVKTALSHKPFQPKSNSYQKFLKETLTKLEELNHTVDLSNEIDELQKKLI